MIDVSWKYLFKWKGSAFNLYRKKTPKHYNVITSFYYTSQVITPQAYRTSYLKCYKYKYFLLIMLICGFSFMWIHINMWFQMWFHMEIKTIF